MASTMVFSDTPPVRFPTNDPPNQDQVLDRGKCDKETRRVESMSMKSYLRSVDSMYWQCHG